MNPKSLLKDAQLQQELNEKGFVKIQVLNDNEIHQLSSYYSEIHPNGAPEKTDGIHMTTWCKDLEYKLSVANRLAEIYRKPCEAIFENYRILNNVFIVKDSGETPFKVHQDWNVVDENENFALNVWIPLNDITKNEGGLWVVEGSHKINRNVRGSAYLFPNYTAFNDELEKAATSVSLKAGQAIVFYVNIIHGSPPNHGETERIATCFSVIPKDAPLTIYFQKNAGAPLEMHSPKDDFMYHYTNLRKESFERGPTSQPSKILPSFVNHPIERMELQPFLSENRMEKKSWWRGILKT
jgi:Phytanoyl-CoA dioxygenase (PhyH)